MHFVNKNNITPPLQMAGPHQEVPSTNDHLNIGVNQSATDRSISKVTDGYLTY